MKPKKDHKRQVILENAMNLYLKNGYAKMSIRMLANEIKSSPSSIYSYFKDKDEIFYELQVQAFMTFNEFVFEECVFKKPISKLKHQCRNYFEFAIKNTLFYELLFMLKAPFNTIESRNLEWKGGRMAINKLKESISETIKEGYFSGFSLKQATYFVFNYLHGIIALYLNKRLSMYDDSDKNVISLVKKSLEDFFELLKSTRKL